MHEIDLGKASLLDYLQHHMELKIPVRISNDAEIIKQLVDVNNNCVLRHASGNKLDLEEFELKATLTAIESRLPLRVGSKKAKAEAEAEAGNGITAGSKTAAATRELELEQLQLHMNWNWSESV